MRKETINILQFDELSDAAKETARQWWREGALDYEWWDCVYDDFESILKILGFDVSQRDIAFSGFWSQGDGASFTGSYAYAKGAALKIRAYAPRDSDLHQFADRLQTMQRRNFYQVTGSISRMGRYVHECTMQCDVERSDDVDWSQDEYDDAQAIFEDVSRDLARWLYSALEREYEYQMSDENVDESIRANEYEFNEDGTRA